MSPIYPVAQTEWLFPHHEFGTSAGAIGPRRLPVRMNYKRAGGLENPPKWEISSKRGVEKPDSGMC